MTPEELRKLSDDAIRAAADTIERLQVKCHILSESSLGNNLCPDHRDKQRGKPCLACEIERLQRENANLIASVKAELDRTCNVVALNAELEKQVAVLTANLEIMCPGGEAELAAMREKTVLTEALNVSEALRRQEVAELENLQSVDKDVITELHRIRSELEEQIKSLIASSVSVIDSMVEAKGGSGYVIPTWQVIALQSAIDAARSQD